MTQRLPSALIVFMIGVSVAACNAQTIPLPPTVPEPTLASTPTPPAPRKLRPTPIPTLTTAQSLIPTDSVHRLPGRLIFSVVTQPISNFPITIETYLVERGQVPQSPLVDAGYTNLSPDGQWLVYKRFDDRGQIHAWAAQINCPLTPGACRLSEPLDLGLYAAEVAWSPDSIHLAYTTAGYSGKEWRSGQLFVANVISRTITTVLDKGAGNPTFSPNGQWVLMQAGYTGYYPAVLAIAAIDGRRYQSFTDSLLNWPARWRPNGDLEISMPNRPEGNGPQVLVSADGISTTQGVYPQAPHQFLYSPDGQRLIYRAQDNIGWLHLANADGSQARPIQSDQHWRAIAWSPDSQHLIIGHFTSKGLTKTRLVQFDQGEETTLPAEQHFIAWIDGESYLASGPTQQAASPDGQTWPHRTPLLRVWLDGHNELLITIAGLADQVVYWNGP
ncbi:MAG: hypothetical protein U0559_12990 [Anaerolineae bacterium]